MKKTERKAVEAQLLDMTEGLVLDSPLTDDERRSCQSIVTEGFHFFDRNNWGQERERAFLARPNVRRELDRLIGMMQDAAALKERHRFFNQLRLYQMLPAAMAVVQRTLVGLPKETNGKVDPLPTPEQLSVARDVINWCGVSEGRVGTLNVNLGIGPPPIERSVKDEPDDAASKYDMGKITQRTRVRSAVEAIFSIAGDADLRLEALETERAETVSRKARRKKRRLREENGE